MLIDPTSLGLLLIFTFFCGAIGWNSIRDILEAQEQEEPQNHIDEVV